MTKREKEILHLIQDNPMISQKECSERLGISRSSVAVHIMNLSNKGYIKGKGYILRDEPYAVVIGGSNMDILGNPESKFIPNDSNRGKVLLSPGGVGRNIAENLARIGSQVKLLTVLGDDLHGKQLLQSCRNAGIDMNQAKVTSEAGTSVYLSIQNEKREMISAISDMSIMNALDIEYLERNHRIIQNASLIMLDTNIPDESLNYLFGRYREKAIFIDTVSTTKARKIHPYLNQIHTLKPNRIEAEILAGVTIEDEKSEEEALQILLNKGVQRIFLSMGHKGVLYRDKETKLFYKHEELQALNTTGAGDAYSAALGYCFLQEYRVEKTLAFAASAAALAIMSEETINKKINAEIIENMMKGELSHE